MGSPRRTFWFHSGAPMSVQFDEEPVRPAGNLDPGSEPSRQAIDAGRLIRLDAAIFHFRNQAPLASSPVEKEGPLD